MSVQRRYTINYMSISDDIFDSIKSLLNLKASAKHTHSYNELESIPNNLATTDDISTERTYADSTFLKLSGSTMTGDITSNKSTFRTKSSNSMSETQICGGISAFDGGTLVVHGKNVADKNLAGSFRLLASDGDTYKEFRGKPDGILVWNGKAINCVDSSGAGWIRYTDGLQICYRGEHVETTGNFKWTYPMEFISIPSISFITTGNSHVNLGWSRVSYDYKVSASCYSLALAVGFWK